MNQKPAGNLRVKHTFVIALVLVGGGLLAWMIQLARQGDAIGYIILTGLGVLLSLLVVGLVLYILIIAIGKTTQVRPYPNEMKTIYETHRVLEAQNREMARLLAQMQRNPTLLTDPEKLPVELGPGQVLTPEGFVIDGTAFDTLEEE